MINNTSKTPTKQYGVICCLCPVIPLRVHGLRTVSLCRRDRSDRPGTSTGHMVPVNDPGPDGRFRSGFNLLIRGFIYVLVFYLCGFFSVSTYVYTHRKQSLFFPSGPTRDYNGRRPGGMFVWTVVLTCFEVGEPRKLEPCFVLL